MSVAPTPRVPPDDDVRLRRVPPQARNAWRLEGLVGTVALAAAVVAAVHLLPVPQGWRAWLGPVLAVVAAGGALEQAVLIPRRHRTHRYALLPDCLVLSRGAVFRTRRTFPLDQVVYVETRQGPFLRRYDLFTVRIGSLAEPHSFGPLPPQAVREIQDAVEKRTAQG